MVKQRGFLDWSEPWRMEWRGLVWITAIWDIASCRVLRMNLVTILVDLSVRFAWSRKFLSTY